MKFIRLAGPLNRRVRVERSWTPIARCCLPPAAVPTLLTSAAVSAVRRCPDLRAPHSSAHHPALQSGTINAHRIEAGVASENEVITRGMGRRVKGNQTASLAALVVR